MNQLLVIFLAHVFLTSACPDPITTVLIHNHDGPIYVSPDSTSDQHVTTGNRLPTCNRSCNRDNHYSRDHSSTYSPTDNPLLHSYPHTTVCETDCKCVTKQLSTRVPINTVPQNTCIGTYYATPDYYYAYPEGKSYGSHGSSYGSTGSSYGSAGSSYGSVGSDYGSVGSCPIATDGWIPVLKTYLGQSKCPKCGQNDSSC